MPGTERWRVRPGIALGAVPIFVGVVLIRTLIDDLAVLPWLAVCGLWLYREPSWAVLAASLFASAGLVAANALGYLGYFLAVAVPSATGILVYPAGDRAGGMHLPWRRALVGSASLLALGGVFVAFARG